uniref:ribosomal protein S2 n=1 Tax=Microstegium vimineum TaxID=91518 RepID=UPI0023F0FC38|nr:ribosomal protein S2 [Microstegium vimineum]WEB60593.1 ribosomal protein S2 [Microstegium vimineum]
MTILSTVCTKLLCTNAHLGRRVAATHFQVYIRGFRNGIAILDSDKTLICLRNAIHFIGSLIRKKGRSFFLKTNHFFIYSIMEKMWSCINDSQWKIGAFLTNSYANPKKFRSRKNQINFGLNQQPDCVVILHPDRKSSVILEADRSLIPIASLVDSTIPCEFYKRIYYPIPANDPIQFVYLFRNSITKTVILERKRITAMNTRAGTTHLSFCTGKSPAGIIIHSRKVGSWTELGSELLPVVANYLQICGEGAESVPQPQGGAAQVVQGTPTPAPQEWTAPLPSIVPPSCYSLTGYVEDWVASNPTFMRDVLNANMVGRGSLVHSSGFPAASGSGPSLNPALTAKDTIYFNLTTLYPSGSLSPGEATDLTNEIFAFKENILKELRRLSGPVNGEILWKDDTSGNTIRNPQRGQEYPPYMLDMILDSLKRYGGNSDYYKQFLNDRMNTLKNADLRNLQLEVLPREKLDELNQSKLLAYRRLN